jgi:hypothetical protein
LAYCGGSGGGFGGSGGQGAAANGSPGGLAGATYNLDLSSKLIGGSGGGRGSDFNGGGAGGGGGAIQLAARGVLVLRGAIGASGGAGGRAIGNECSVFNGCTAGAAGGGGSGGAILIQAARVDLQGGSLWANGAAAGVYYPNKTYWLSSGPIPSPDAPGGGGGGGRIHIAYKLSASGSPATFVLGGAGSAATNSGASGTVTITQDAKVPAAVAPAITQGPHSRTNVVGSSAVFSVDVTGSDLHYVWHRGAAVVGGDSASLSIASVTIADAGSYSVTVSNILGVATSDTAILTVAPSKLSADRIADEQVQIKWSNQLPGAILETTTDLRGDAQWTAVPNTGVSAVIGATNTTGYYRLRIP